MQQQRQQQSVANKLSDAKKNQQSHTRAEISSNLGQVNAQREILIVEPWNNLIMIEVLTFFDYSHRYDIDTNRNSRNSNGNFFFNG